MSVLNQFRLDDRVALVTGGARGIGKAMAAALGQAGAKLAIGDLNVEMAEATVTELKEAGHEAFAIKADVADQDSVRAMVASVSEHYGSLDIAFNNAGVNYNSAERINDGYNIYSGEGEKRNSFRIITKFS